MAAQEIARIKPDAESDQEFLRRNLLFQTESGQIADIVIGELIARLSRFCFAAIGLGNDSQSSENARNLTRIRDLRIRLLSS
jgi:hypothetical protein